MTARSLVIGVSAFIAMEGTAALVHRFVMHRSGWGWHESHHAPVTGRFERNDRFPLVFAALTVVALVAGVFVEGLGVLVPIGWGVTAYGSAYLVVHDLGIHRRVRRVRLPDPFIGRLRAAHHVHHVTGEAPYGFVVPLASRARREAAARFPADRTIRTR